MRKRVAGVLLSALLLIMVGCEHKHELNRELRISTNPWIGFTPLVYAQQQGWLEDTHIKLLWVVGLEENLKLYRQGLSNGFTATQYEYLALDNPDEAAPYFLFDRSVGADVILSNRSITELKKSTQTAAYLEITSLNNDLLNAFIAENGLDKNAITLTPTDPEAMTTFLPADIPMLLVAYEPYASAIERNGFRRIASTAELTNVQVIDGLFLNKVAAKYHKTDIATLKAAVDRAIEQLEHDPEHYFETVSPYLKNQSYEAFLKSLEGVEWMHKDPPASILEHLRAQQIATEMLLP